MNVLTSSPQTIVCTTFKGGVSKTTLAVNVAAALARRGHEVQGVDIDRTNIDFSSFAPNLDFNVRSLSAGRLGAWTQKPGPEYLVVDCPPAASRATALALRHADLAIVPVVPNLLAVRGLERVVELLSAVRDPEREGSNPSLQVMIVVTMYEHSDEDARDFEGQLRELFGATIWPQNIPKLKLINAANNRLLSIFNHAPRSEGARLFRDLASDIETRLPLKDLSHAHEAATV